jgi:hypothetical protein
MIDLEEWLKQLDGPAMARYLEAKLLADAAQAALTEAEANPTPVSIRAAYVAFEAIPAC